MRYVGELNQAASDAGSRGASRQRQQYLRRAAKELSAAACADNPVEALKVIAGRYKEQDQTGAKPVEVVKMLIEATNALFLGQDPASITLVVE